MSLFVFALTLSWQIGAIAGPLSPADVTPNTVPRYSTVAMKDGKGSRDVAKGVVYMINENRWMRENCRVVIRDGVVYTAKGEIHADSKNENHDIENYVMDEFGNFYVFDEYTTPEIRHSSIFGGGPVAGGGEIQIKNGHVTYIDSNSGHYSTRKAMRNVLRELESDGVDMQALHSPDK